MTKMSAAKFAEVKKFISDFIDENGYSPSLAEIVHGTGMPQTTAYRYVNTLIERGELDFSGRRSVKVSEISAPIVRTPVLGRVACGIPKYAEENIEEYVKLPVAIFGKGDFYLLRANGDSMIEADIKDNDLVLIRRQDTAEAGQIVVALVDDEATLKRL